MWGINCEQPSVSHHQRDLLPPAIWTSMRPISSVAIHVWVTATDQSMGKNENRGVHTRERDRKTDRKKRPAHACQNATEKAPTANDMDTC